MTTKEIIELSASVIGSLATAAACIIALWQTKIQIKPKLKLKDRTIFITKPNDDIDIFIGLDIVNSGYAKVIIREWCIPVKKGKKLVLIPEQILNFKNLPCTLEPGESVSLLFSPNKFKEVLKNAVEQGLLDNKSKLKFEIRDSLDNVYSIKISPTNKWLKYDKK